MPPGGLGKIALCAMPVGLEDSPNGHGFAALWVEFPSDPLRAVVPCSMPKRFAFSAQNTVPPFRASQLCPFFMSWNGKRPSLVFSSRGTGKLPSGNNPLRLRLFFMRNRETFTKRESAAAPQPFPDPFTKVLGGRGVGFGEGRGKPFSRKVPSPLPNLPYPRPLNCRLSPTLMVTRSRSKYSRSGMTYLRERPPESSLNPAGSRSSWEVNHACIRALSS